MKNNYVKPELAVAETDDELIFFEPPKMLFWHKLAIYCTAWFILIAIACFTMWSVMEQYHAAQPHTAMDEYMSLSKQEIFFDSIAPSLQGFEENRYEPTYSTSGRIADMYTGTLSYVKVNNEFTEANPVYIIRHNDENMFKITLERGDSTGFMGYEGYRVKKCELIKDDLLSFKSYRLVFSSDSYIFINERKLESKISGVFERFDIFGNNNYYGIILENMLLEPKISAQRVNTSTFSTTPIDGYREGEYFIFPYSGGELHTVTITAPKNATVKIGNKIVSDIFITDTVAEADGMMKIYTVPTVHGEQTVTAYIGATPIKVTADGYNYTAK